MCLSHRQHKSLLLAFCNRYKVICCDFYAHCIVSASILHYALSINLHLTSPHPIFNKAGLLAWVHTCHFALHVAGWEGSSLHLSLTHSWVWHTPHSLAHPVPCRVCHCYPYCSIHFRVCCCHPYCIAGYNRGVSATLIVFTLQGVLMPPLACAKVHPTTFSPIYCQ